jgi:hypothetical protein
MCRHIAKSRQKSLQSTAAKEESSIASAARTQVTQRSQFLQLKIKPFTLLFHCVFSVNTCKILLEVLYF